MNWFTEVTTASELMRAVLATDGATLMTMSLEPEQLRDLKKSLTAKEPILSGVPSMVPSGEGLRQAGTPSKLKTGLSTPMTLNCTV